jgi:hypothetical protein
MKRGFPSDGSMFVENFLACAARAAKCLSEPDKKRERDTDHSLESRKLIEDGVTRNIKSGSPVHGLSGGFCAGSSAVSQPLDKNVTGCAARAWRSTDGEI